MYTPAIKEDNVRKLYRLKLLKKRPMTKLLNEILDNYFKAHEEKSQGAETSTR